jgi:chromosome segregation ATPase
MTKDEIVTALREHAEWAAGNEWETPITLGDNLSAAVDLIENQQRHIEALMKANAGLRDTVLRRDAQIADMSEGLAQFSKAVAEKEENNGTTYEDTGLTPGDIKELLDVAASKTNKVLRLKEELHAMKNELCQYCGKYKRAHEGACDGCRWREM